MRKFILLGSALLLGFGMNVASAQQLPNVGFKSWKETMGQTYYMGFSNGPLPRPAANDDETEPAGWNGSNVEQMGQTGFFVGKEVDETGNVAVELKNDFVGIPALGLGANAPGFITFATPWVYANFNTKICDGGVFGGVEFSYKPDAIKGKFKKYAEGDAPETSHVIAYLWNGTFTSEIGSTNNTQRETQNDVDRAIMRPENAGTVSGNGKLVASCDYEITSTDGKWQEIVVPLIYVEGAGKPEKMNVIISAADYWNRSSIQAGTTLSADDVDFVYYSTLTGLEVGGAAVPDFAANKYVYDMGVVTALPTAESISAGAVAKSPRANVEVTVDEAAWQVCVAVTNQGGKDLDGETSHTYTLQYTKATEYAGYLNINMDGMPLTYNADATVRIVDYKDGTCDFVLPNFTLNMGGSQLELGDITVPEATMTEDASGVKTFEGLVPEMSLVGGITARVELNGTIDAEGKADFDVDVAWLNGGSEIPIAVTFTSDMVGEELGGYYYIVENGDYENPVEEKTQVTLASYPVGSAGDVACRLVLSDVNYGGATADIVVEGIGMTEANTYSGTATDVALPDGTVAEKVAVEDRTTDGVHYDIKFTVTAGGSESVIGFTTEPVTSGVDSVAAGEVAVYGADGAIVVDGFDGEVAVYAADGQLVKSAAVDGHAEIAVAGGLYVVRAGEAVKKVIVK